MSKPMSLEKKFWRGVDKADSDKCWLWKGCSSPKDYGNIRHNGRMIGVHKVSYMIHIGDIPDNRIVCHKCDTPACCNPSHLFIGSYSANALDCSRKGRKMNSGFQPRFHSGERWLMCRLYNNGVTQTLIAKMFKTAQPVVSRICIKGVENE